MKNLEEFNPLYVEIGELIQTTKNITATDLKDKSQLEVVKRNRIALRDTRVKIEKIGKALREDATAFSKAVIAKEKELIAELTPEEDRLQAIELEAKSILIKEQRAEKLPFILEMIKDKGYTDFHKKSDEDMLQLDETQMNEYLQSLVEARNEFIAAEQQKKEDDLKAREEEILRQEEEKRREKEIEDAKELGRQQALQESQTTTITKEQISEAKDGEVVVVPPTIIADAMVAASEQVSPEVLKNGVEGPIDEIATYKPGETLMKSQSVQTNIFEDYLKEVHAKFYDGTDDDMSDRFDDWLIQLDADEWLNYGEKFAILYAGGK